MRPTGHASRQAGSFAVSLDDGLVQYPAELGGSCQAECVYVLREKGTIYINLPYYYQSPRLLYPLVFLYHFHLYFISRYNPENQQFLTHSLKFIRVLQLIPFTRDNFHNKIHAYGQLQSTVYFFCATHVIIFTWGLQLHRHREWEPHSFRLHIPGCPSRETCQEPPLQKAQAHARSSSSLSELDQV